MANRYYTEKEIEGIKEMRASGATWAEISKRFNRSERALGLKFSGLPKRKNKKRKKSVVKFENGAEVTLEKTRPMIALVGSPQEVTATIRELFS